MCPTLVPGDYVVIDARSSEAIELGAIVVARLPEDDTVVIKRLRSRGDYTVFLGSDDPNVGRDSRHFGSLPGGSVVGEVILHLGTSRIGAAWRSRAAL
ncbi:MAG: hypothetical protein GY811_24480 [Myxococcales bacterium]|nr:hypothetical protein [Myxococcales bacterium]